MVDNVKSHMNQDLFHFVNGCYILGINIFISQIDAYILKGDLRADNAIIYTATKIGIRYIRFAFSHTICMRIIKKPSELG